MATIIDTLHHSPVTKSLSDTELMNIARLFKVQHYQAGQTVSLSERNNPDDLTILANGSLKVKIPCGIGEATVCELLPGDLIDLSTLSNSSTMQASLYAQNSVALLSMQKNQFDNLVYSNPLLMCRIMHGMMHSMQNIARRMGRQIIDMRNYIYSGNGSD